MLIAKHLKKTSPAEHVLYLWQVEDVLRAYGCDSERIEKEYLPKFQLTGDDLAATTRWYADLCTMMHEEGKMGCGHLQISQNALQELAELHQKLLASERFPYYREMYYKVLPYIVELRARGANKDEGELQVCFDALYGVLTLKMQKREISDATSAAVKDISTLLGQLSDYALRDAEEPLDF